MLSASVHNTYLIDYCIIYNSFIPFPRWPLWLHLFPRHTARTLCVDACALAAADAFNVMPLDAATALLHVRSPLPGLLITRPHHGGDAGRRRDGGSIKVRFVYRHILLQAPHHRGDFMSLPKSCTCRFSSNW